MGKGDAHRMAGLRGREGELYRCILLACQVAVLQVLDLGAVRYLEADGDTPLAVLGLGGIQARCIGARGCLQCVVDFQRSAADVVDGACEGEGRIGTAVGGYGKPLKSSIGLSVLLRLYFRHKIKFIHGN